MYEPIKPARTLGNWRSSYLIAWKYTVIREVEDSDFAFEAYQLDAHKQYKQNVGFESNLLIRRYRQQYIKILLPVRLIYFWRFLGIGLQGQIYQIL